MDKYLAALNMLVVMSGAAKILQQGIEIVTWKIVIICTKTVNRFMLVDEMNQAAHSKDRVRA